MAEGSGRIYSKFSETSNKISFSLKDCLKEDPSRNNNADKPPCFKIKGGSGVTSGSKLQSYYKSQPTYAKRPSLQHDINNFKLLSNNSTQKVFIKEVDEEENMKELNEYCKDDSTFHKQHQSVNYQCNRSIDSINSGRKTIPSQGIIEDPHLQQESVLSIYQDQDVKFNNTLNLFDNTTNYQNLNEHQYSPNLDRKFNSTRRSLNKSKDEIMTITHRSISDSMFQDNNCLANLNNLISNSHDWKNIQGVVRNALKLVVDTLFIQENQINFLVSELANKASKSELDTKLTNKPSHAEMTMLFQECANKLDSKVDAAESILTIKDIDKLEEKFVTKQEYSLHGNFTSSSNLSKEIMFLKQNYEEIKSDLSVVNNNFTSFSSIVKRQIGETEVEIKEISNFVNEKKVGIEEFKKALDGKANKHSVATALHRKANKQEVEEELNKIIRTNELDRILQLLENKASKSDVERLESIIEDMNSVIEEINNLASSKLTRDEVAMLLISQQSEADKAAKSSISFDMINQLKNLEKNVKEDIDLLKTDLYAKLQLKADGQSIVDINTLISRKADNDRVSLLISQNKNNIIDILENYK